MTINNKMMFAIGALLIGSALCVFAYRSLSDWPHRYEERAPGFWPSGARMTEHVQVGRIYMFEKTDDGTFLVFTNPQGAFALLKDFESGYIVDVENRSGDMLTIATGKPLGDGRSVIKIRPGYSCIIVRTADEYRLPACSVRRTETN